MILLFPHYICIQSTTNDIKNQPSTYIAIMYLEHYKFCIQHYYNQIQFYTYLLYNEYQSIFSIKTFIQIEKF